MTHTRVLAIDPASTLCGYAVVDFPGGSARPTLVGCGVFKAKASASPAARLAEIQSDIESMVFETKPDRAVIEQPFVHSRGGSGVIIVGAAYGVCLCVLQRAGLSPVIVDPMTVKKAVVGYAGSKKHKVGKEQVEAAVRAQLSITGSFPSPDAADAIAIAIAGASLLTNGALNDNRPRQRRAKRSTGLFR